MEISKQVGPVLLDAAIKGEALVLSVSYPLMSVIEGLAEKAKAAIPGQFDDAMIDVFMAALKAEAAKV